MKELFHRISVRKYEAREVEDEKLVEILRAGMQAPSAGNQQPWEFYIIKDAERRAALGEVHQWATPAAEAPVSIVSAYREETRMPEYTPQDMAICMENMWLMIDALGLGGVWLGIAPVEERMRKVEEIAGIPSGQRAFGILTVGYPAEERPQADRFEAERSHGLEVPHGA